MRVMLIALPYVVQSVLYGNIVDLVVLRRLLHCRRDLVCSLLGEDECSLMAGMGFTLTSVRLL